MDWERSPHDVSAASGRLFERITDDAVAPPRSDGADLFQDMEKASPEAASSLRALCDDIPAFRRLLVCVAENAPFLRDLIRVDPGRVLACATEAPETRINALCERIAELPGDDEAALMADLRRARCDMALTVALADLGRVWNADLVVSALSAFAEAALQRAVVHALDVEMRSGRLIETDTSESGFFMLAMGKFGARELNYSSDIDLIALYDPDRVRLTDPYIATKTFVAVTRRIVRMLQDRTAEGYVCRVDLRLRPDPGSTSLVLSTPAAFNYYESAGQNWERAAMIKARPVAGDLAAGAEFLNELHPFVWRKYLDYSAISDIHSIKRQIHAHRGFGAIAVAGHNVKLGRGGIREIEFFVQTQQLIAGGRNLALRGRETLSMLGALAEQGWIGPETADELRCAYRYLRGLEHRIQMLRDEQTHRIPDKPDGLAAVAALSGDVEVSAFEARTRSLLERVQHHYSKLFEDEPSLSSAEGNLVFTGESDDPETLETLSNMGFSRPEDISAAIRGWHAGRFPATRMKRAREHLTKLVPAFLEAVADTQNADAVFVAFDRFIAQLPAGIQLFSLLRSNPGLLSLLVTVMGAAPRLARTIVRRAHVLDSLLEPDFFGRMPERAIIAARLSQTLGEASGYEDGLDRARIFGQEQAFLIGVRVVTGTLPHDQAGRAYAALADLLLKALFRHVRSEFERVHGRVSGGQVALLAMGKLGGREMTAASDLDLILLYTHDADAKSSDGPKSLASSQYYIRLTQRFIAAISAPTSEGCLYEVDFRLRPSGRAGPLATHISSFDQYQHETAWIWEHMALTRARVVFGDPELRQNALDCVAGVLTAPRDLDIVRREVAAMRARVEQDKPAVSVWEIKTRPGGLIDIEFMAQCLQLAHGCKNPDILDANTMIVLRRARSAGLLGEDDALILTRACALYEDLTQVMRLAVEGTFDAERAPARLKDILAGIGEMPDFATLEAYLLETQAEVRTVFERIVGVAQQP